MYKLMRVPEKGKTAGTFSMDASFNGSPFKVDLSQGFSICMQVLDETPESGDTFVSGVIETQTLTFPTRAASGHNDYVVLSDYLGVNWAVAIAKPAFAVVTPNFADLASTNDGDFFTFIDTAGNTWAIALDTTGGALVTPTAAAWLAVPAGRKSLVNVFGAVNDEDIAALVLTALNALTGFTALFTIVDPADGTLTITSDAYGATGTPTRSNFDASGNGSIAITLSTTGLALSAPVGATWTAIPADHKAQVDLTAGGASTAAQVAAAVETAIDALTGFSAVIATDDSAADGTMLLTAAERGPVTNPVPRDAAGSGAGTILGVQTTGGVTSSVDLVDNEVTIPSHGANTGLKVRLTTSVTLPTGLATATDYFIIAIDANTVQFASSLQNALDGVEIDITGYGTGTHTLDVEDELEGTVKLQASNNAFQDNVNMELRDDTFWVDVPNMSATLDGGDDTVFWNVSDVYYEAVRIVWTRTIGQGTGQFYFLAKGGD